MKLIKVEIELYVPDDEDIDIVNESLYEHCATWYDVKRLEGNVVEENAIIQDNE